MTDKIDGAGLPPRTPSTSQSISGATSGQRPNSNAETDSANRGVEASKTERVSLTSTATVYADLAAKIDAAPAVDQQRVEQISREIAEGSYQTDSARIADAIISSDRQL